MKEIPGRLERILDLHNEVEANLLDAVLTDKQIPHTIRSMHDTAYNGLIQAQTGCWGWVEAPVEERDAILALYRDIVVDREDNQMLDDAEDEMSVESEPPAPGKKTGRPDPMFVGILFVLAGLVALGIILIVSGH